MGWCMLYWWCWAMEIFLIDFLRSSSDSCLRSDQVLVEHPIYSLQYFKEISYLATTDNTSSYKIFVIFTILFLYKNIIIIIQHNSRECWNYITSVSILLIFLFRSKNTVNILIKNMLDAFIGGVSYWSVYLSRSFQHILLHIHTGL